MKKIKNFLLVLLLIPCLLFAGCSQDISAQEFEVLKGDAATNYYQNYYGKNMTVTFEVNSESSGTRDVHYGYYYDSVIVADFYTSEKTTQTIEVYDSGIKDLPNIRVTTVSDYTDEGFESNGSDDGIVSYKRTGKVEQVVTFVCTLVNGKKEVSAYSYTESYQTENGGEEVCEIKKSSYTFANENAGIEAIEEILIDVDERMMAGFFNNFATIVEAANGKAEFFKTGNGAGYEAVVDVSEVYNKNIINEQINMSVKLSNNLPLDFAMSAQNSYISAITPDGYANEESTIDLSVNVQYTCNPVEKPQGFYNVVSEYPEVEIEYASIFAL